jgi:hypothetical protein
MSNPLQTGVFVPSSNIWDISELYSVDLSKPEQLRELLVRLYQNLNRMSLAINVKDTGYYPRQELVNSQLWFPNPALNSSTTTFPAYRQVYRKVINMGALPNGSTGTATTIQPHFIPINSSYTFTRIYGAASDTTDLEYIPIPNGGNSPDESVNLLVDATDVIITVDGADFSNYNICYVVLEYITS